MEATFDSILKELGEQVDCELSEGANGTCLLKLESECQIQLEWSSAPLRLHVFCKLGEVAGNQNTRRALLLSALKANGSENRKGPILSFSDLHKNLMLYQPIEVQEIDARQLGDSLLLFEEEALIWIEALRNGRPPRDFAVNDSTNQLFDAMKWKT